MREREPEPLHQRTSETSRNLYAALQQIARSYSGDASRIWSDSPSSAGLICRRLEFRRVGPKIANRAANLLARRFRLPLQDYHSIDIQLDAHVRRVFTRLGLVPEQSSNDPIPFKARTLHPDFPGLLTLPAWDIGDKWCLTREPHCGKCDMNDVCPTGPSERATGADRAPYRPPISLR